MPENLYSAAFDDFFSRVIQHEAGYVNDPDDPGGETKFGISKRQFPGLDIKNLTIEQARTIYSREYWHRPGFWRLPALLSIRVADVGVTAGQATAIKMMQRAANTVCAGNVPQRRRAPWRQKVVRLLHGGTLRVDGQIGPITEHVIKAYPYRFALMVAFQDEAYNHYRKLNPLYIPGWLERLGT